MIIPPPYPCKACETKEGKNTDSTFFFLSFIYILLCYINYYNLAKFEWQGR